LFSGSEDPLLLLCSHLSFLPPFFNRVPRTAKLPQARGEWRQEMSKAQLKSPTAAQHPRNILHRGFVTMIANVDLQRPGEVRCTDRYYEVSFTPSFAAMGHIYRCR
jgi:hypothetical protein